MTNPANNGTLIGRLSQDIKAFPNADGSSKLLINVAVEDDYKSGPDKKVQTNFIQVERFVPAGAVAGGWDRVRKGDLIAFATRIDAKPYTNKQNETVYPLKLVATGFPTFLEPKSVTEKRAAENAVKHAQAQSQGATASGTSDATDRIAALEAELAAARGESVNYDDTVPFAG